MEKVDIPRRHHHYGPLIRMKNAHQDVGLRVGLVMMMGMRRAVEPVTRILEREAMINVWGSSYCPAFETPSNERMEHTKRLYRLRR
jgi:hypothetical protein